MHRHPVVPCPYVTRIDEAKLPRRMGSVVGAFGEERTRTAPDWAIDNMLRLCIAEEREHGSIAVSLKKKKFAATPTSSSGDRIAHQ